MVCDRAFYPLTKSASNGQEIRAHVAARFLAPHPFEFLTYRLGGGLGHRLPGLTRQLLREFVGFSGFDIQRHTPPRQKTFYLLSLG